MNMMDGPGDLGLSCFVVLTLVSGCLQFYNKPDNWSKDATDYSDHNFRI